jgi:hypothetical protein
MQQLLHDLTVDGRITLTLLLRLLCDLGGSSDRQYPEH